MICLSSSGRRQDSALKLHVGHSAIVLGDSQASELYRRITTVNAAERMPPSDSETVLTDAVREVLKHETLAAELPPKEMRRHAD